MFAHFLPLDLPNSTRNNLSNHFRFHLLFPLHNHISNRLSSHILCLIIGCFVDFHIDYSAQILGHSRNSNLFLLILLVDYRCFHLKSRLLLQLVTLFEFFESKLYHFVPNLYFLKVHYSPQSH